MRTAEEKKMDDRRAVRALRKAFVSVKGIYFQARAERRW